MFGRLISDLPKQEERHYLKIQRPIQGEQAKSYTLKPSCNAILTARVLVLSQTVAR
jgi:hypothetical protein